MNPTPPPTRVGPVVALLAAQAFALGLTVAWVTIPASAIFLDAYGAGALPYTYIGAAIAGTVVTALLGRSLRRHTLIWVTIRALAGFAAALIAAAGLSSTGAWVAVGLLVFVPILVPVGFMFVVGQAGMLLDVRVLKSLYPRVIAGFAFGLVIGGAIGPFLIGAFGRTEALLALAAGVAVVFFILAGTTGRRYPVQLAAADTSAAEGERPTLRALVRNRYVLWIMVFQMLSAVESQWLDFLVYDRAVQRYSSSEDLASFISTFTAIAYGSDIVFLLVIAGFLLRRYGLRYGLTANAATVMALVLATIAASTIVGATSTIAFVLVGASRVSDLTLSDGATRASLSAAYQAVSTRERQATQAAVEGLAVPVAIGASGVALIVVGETIGTQGIALPFMTSIVVLAWIIVAARVHGGYRTNLLTNLRRRVLDPAGLPTDDPSTLAAIDRLLGSDDERDVRLGLQTLEAARHPELTSRLARAAVDQRANVRQHALDRLTVADPHAAAAAAREGLDHDDPRLRAASLRTLAHTGTGSDATAFTSAWPDDDDDVSVAAATGLARLGSDSTRRALSAELDQLANSPDRREAMLAARILGVCEPGSGIDRGGLEVILRHTDAGIAVAGLEAVRWPADAHLLPQIVALVDRRRTSRSACAALARGADAVLGHADDVLAGRLAMSREARVSFVGVCTAIGSAGARDVLVPHLADRDREVGIAIAHALADGGASVADIDIDHLVRAEVESAAHTARALAVLDDSPHTGVLCWALRDEANLIARRLVAVLSIRYGTGATRAVQELERDDPRSHAMAMEWLDVTLVGDERALLALVEPHWSVSRRAKALDRWVTTPGADLRDVLSEMIDDPADRWRRPWIRACAIHVAHHAAIDHLIPWDVAQTEVPAASEATIVPETVAAIAARRKG